VNCLSAILALLIPLTAGAARPHQEGDAQTHLKQALRAGAQLGFRFEWRDGELQIPKFEPLGKAITVRTDSLGLFFYFKTSDGQAFNRLADAVKSLRFHALALTTMTDQLKSSEQTELQELITWGALSFLRIDYSAGFFSGRTLYSGESFVPREITQRYQREIIDGMAKKLGAEVHSAKFLMLASGSSCHSSARAYWRARASFNRPLQRMAIMRDYMDTSETALMYEMAEWAGTTAYFMGPSMQMRGPSRRCDNIDPVFWDILQNSSAICFSPAGCVSLK
jgi:hypothetical protein